MTDGFQQFADEYAVYGYPVLFAGVLLENAAVPVPGETAVLVAGFLASPAGGGRFSLPVVILLTFMAAVIGDNLGFWLGHRWARPRLRAGRKFLFLTPAAMQMAEAYFTRYGLWTVFFARFVVGLRVVGALAAGTAGMSWPRFLAANAAGALAWGTAVSCLGFFFGRSWELLERWLGRGALIIGGVVVLVVALPAVGRHLQKLTPGLYERLARTSLWPGLVLAVLEALFVAVLVLLAQGDRATRLDLAVTGWLEAHPEPLLRYFAEAASFAGSLPVVAIVTAALIFWSVRRGEDRPAVWGAAGALAASEALGLLVVALLRHSHVDPVHAAAWPFGFAGLIPLRAVAVWGMAAYLLTRAFPGWGRVFGGVAAVFIFLAGFGVVWTRWQLPTETLLEGAAGGLVLVAGIWAMQEFGTVSPAPEGSLG